MKAISPVIATLILIAIAVIAGVFVLRQFIRLSTTSGQQNMLQVQDLTFFRTVSPDGSKMNVTLQFSVKNVGQRQIVLWAVKINELNKEIAVGTPGQGVRLNPGQVYSDSVPVLTNEAYTQNWDSGTEHVVTFIYQVQGQPDNQTIAQKGTVQ